MLKLINYILIYLVLIPIIKPDGINHIYPIVDKILYNNLFVMAAITISFFMLFFSVKNSKKISVISILFWIFFAYIFIITFICKGPINSLLLTWSKSIAIWNLIEAYKKDLFKPLRCMQVILEILVGINLVLIILYKDGMYTEILGYTDCWLLGYKSTFQYYFFLLLAITFIFKIYLNERKNFIFVISIIHIQTILAWNAMFLVVLVIIDVILILNIMKKRFLFNVKMCTITICSMNIFFIFIAKYIFNNKFMYYIFNTVLKKNVTLLVRFDIWEKGIEYIKESLIIGYGFTTSKEMISLFGIRQVHLHNQILMLLLQGGLIWLALFCLVMWIILKKLNRYRELESSKIILLMIFSVFISVIVEIFTTGNAYLIWVIFILGYYTKQVDLQLKNNKKNKLKFKKYNFKFN